MKTTKLLACLLAAGFLFSNCGGKDEEEKKEAPKTGLEALKNIADEAEKLSKEGSKEVVDAKILKELLPADADGLPRKKNRCYGF